jgi:hypothetical protein
MKAMNGVRLMAIRGLGDPFACHMGHIGLGPHPKSKHALSECYTNLYIRQIISNGSSSLRLAISMLFSFTFSMV